MFEGIKKMLGMEPGPDLGELIRNGALILDVRSKGEFSGGHVKGAVNIPLDQLGSNMGKLKAKNKVIITCCASGMRSASAKGMLRANGIEAHNGGSWQRVDQLIP